MSCRKLLPWAFDINLSIPKHFALNTSTMHIRAAAKSDLGRKRPQNQDAFLIDKEMGIYLVCDGMGGHAAGDIASTKAVEFTAEILRQHRHEIHKVIAKPGGHFKVVQMVTDSVRMACQLVYQLAADNPGYSGMGTTLTLMLTVGEKAVMAHVGDSRMYLLRAGELHQLTSDHTLTNELIQTGRISAESPDAERFSHVLTRCVGNQEFVDVETLLFDLLPNDRFLLCSDGLSNYFANKDEVVQILGEADIRQTPTALINLANDRGGNDNITSMVVEVLEGCEESVAETRNKLDALEGTFLCRGLSLNRRMRVANIGQIQTYEEREWIIQKGDDRTGMYVVLAGSCANTRPSGIKESLHLGDCFGETGLARGDKFCVQVRAKSAATVLFLPRDSFRELVRRIPKLGRRLLDNLLDHISYQYDELLADGAELTEFGVWVREDEEE